MATPTSTNLPTRTLTQGSDDDAIPGEDTSEVGFYSPQEKQITYEGQPDSE